MEKLGLSSVEIKPLNGIWILIVDLNRSMRYTDPGACPSRA